VKSRTNGPHLQTPSSIKPISRKLPFAVTAVALILFTPARASARIEFHVAPTGNDRTGDGSSSKPFATLGRARITGNTVVACGKSWLNHDNGAGGGAAILEPNFEKLPAKAIVQTGRMVMVEATDLCFEKPETGLREEARK
jgi:hypothetical protein